MWVEASVGVRTKKTERWLVWKIDASDASAHSVGATEVHRLPRIWGVSALQQVRHITLSVAWSDEQREGVKQRKWS